MGHCIFCRSKTEEFTTREHILPESLGGGDWALLADGLMCDSCQNRFGSAVEQQALGDYPFSLFRVFLGVPTKKGSAPWLSSWQGIIRGSLRPGTIGYDPAVKCEAAAFEGRMTQIRLPAHPLKPQFTCRTLLKMGLEVVANDNPRDIFESRYDDARRFALTGEKADPWWFIQQEDMTTASRLMTQGVSAREWADGVELGMMEPEPGLEVFRLRLLYLTLIVPLQSGVRPPEMDDLPEPEFRLFVV